MSATPRAPGYLYGYNFSIKEELVSTYKHKFMLGHKTLIFEIRTSFIAREINGDEVMIDSEVLDSVLYDDGNTAFTVTMNAMLTSRLEDYWMSNSEIHTFEDEAVDFARRAADPPRRVVPVFVDFKVITLQLQGEPVTAALDRALRAKNLVPFFTWPLSRSTAKKWRRIPLYIQDFVIYLTKFRVGDIDSGFAMMETCNLCMQGPNIGSQISMSRLCGHAFHSHCFAEWLLRGNKLCPTCPAVVCDFDALIFDFEDYI